MAEAPDGLTELLEESAILGTDWITNKKVKEIFFLARSIDA